MKTQKLWLDLVFLDENQHPERPWWRRLSQVERADVLTSHRGIWDPREFDFLTAWSRLDGKSAWLDSSSIDLAHSGARNLLSGVEIDRQFPLAPPLPMPGQMWAKKNMVFSSTGEPLTQWHLASVQEVTLSSGASSFVTGSSDWLSMGLWPPPGAVLLSGPSQYARDTQWALEAVL